ncbi:sigma-70 family RNA polymerase sigma factor [Nocardia noduli]|uniref:sigma-70 family RNA polymerase sigma factor n=1 Tax=Nocardia noduli TaxID=2815722 RepID=UPI001C228C56|nr:sigma-70 family RNA polymerase sigma factor [Nocardia noduli]
MGTSDFGVFPSDTVSSDLESVSPAVSMNPVDDLFDPVMGEIDVPVLRSESSDIMVEVEMGGAGPAAADALRMQAELELYELLTADGISALVWEKVVEELSAYGSQVLDPWIRNGVIYAKARRLVIGLPDWPAGRERLAGDRNYRQDMIAHTIVGALGKLHTNLSTDQGWDPRKGATLSSFFITGCLIEFVSVFDKERVWWTTHHAGPVDFVEATELVESGRAVLWGTQLGADPAEVVTNRVVLFDYLATLSADERLILWANVNGYSHAEIAQLLGVTTKAVERRLYRLRESARMSVRSLG